MEHGWIDATASEIAAFDVFQVPWWNIDGDAGAVLDSARAMNPDLFVMGYVNLLGASVPSQGDPGHIVNQFLPQVSEQWAAVNEFGEPLSFALWPEMKIMNLTIKCPRINGRTWGDFLADFVAQDLLSTGELDGIHWDYLTAQISWLEDYVEGHLDMDMNGIPDDPDSVNVWWQLGVENALQRFRAQAGYDWVSEGNGDATFYEHCNGRFFEAFPRGGWSEDMMQGDRWRQYGVEPTLLLVSTRGAVDDYRIMRFGLCSALMVGGVFWHEPPEPPFLNMTIYDEFLVDLGRPLGERYEIGIDTVFEFDLEAGMPDGLETCGHGGTWITEEPGWVIAGARSLVGTADEPPRVWNNFVCTDASLVPLAPHSTYTVEFDYLIVEEPPADGYFYVGAANGSTLIGIYDVNRAAGSSGHVRDSFTLGSPPDYYLYFGLKDGGTVVIDNIRVTEGQGGVFRRDFDRGIALVNPGDTARMIDLGDVYYRFVGEQDPATNNGQPVSVLTLPPVDGLLLLYQPAGGPAGVESAASSAPLSSRLLGASPNPTGGETTIRFSLKQPGHVNLRVFDANGRLVRNLVDGMIETGGALEGVTWDGRDQAGRRVGSGVYFYRLESGMEVQTGQCIVLR